jgi:hypothetical protein
VFDYKEFFIDMSIILGGLLFWGFFLFLFSWLIFGVWW